MEQARPADQDPTLLVVKRTRAPRSDSGQKHAKVQSPEETQLFAATFCVALSGVAIALTNNPQAAMTEGEQALIKPALIATLENLSEEVKGKINRWSSPLLLMSGLALWGLRISAAGGAALKPKMAPAKPAFENAPSVAIPLSVPGKKEAPPTSGNDRLDGMLGGGLS